MVAPCLDYRGRGATGDTDQDRVRRTPEAPERDRGAERSDDEDGRRTLERPTGRYPSQRRNPIRVAPPACPDRLTDGVAPTGG